MHVHISFAYRYRNISPNWYYRATLQSPANFRMMLCHSHGWPRVVRVGPCAFRVLHECNSTVFYGFMSGFCKSCIMAGFPFSGDLQRCWIIHQVIVVETVVVSVDWWLPEVELLYFSRSRFIVYSLIVMITHKGCLLFVLLILFFSKYMKLLFRSKSFSFDSWP